MSKVKQKKTPRTVYYVDPTFWDENEKAFRVAIVVEGENGYRWTGDDDHATNPRAKRPYFWGPTLKAAQAMAATQNAKMGISANDAQEIVYSSMFPKGKKPRRKR